MKKQNSRKTSKKTNKTKTKKDKNIVKLKTNFTSSNLIHSSKLKAMLIITVLIFLALIVRIGFLQFVQGNSLREMAYQQQTINQIISPKRGNIYDSTGKALAIRCSS